MKALSVFGAVVLWLSAVSASAQSWPPHGEPTSVAVWTVNSPEVQGAGRLPEFLLDRLGSNGGYLIHDHEQVAAAGKFVRLGAGDHFDRTKLLALGAALDAPWVLWVKVVDRGVDFKQGLSIPYLLTRRTAKSHMLVDARLLHVKSGVVAGSRRFRFDESGKGSYQVVDDVRQDPLYNNSTVQLFQDATKLEWLAARAISIWFKNLMPRLTEQVLLTRDDPLLEDDPFGKSTPHERK